MTNVNEMPLAVSIKTEPGIEDCFKKPFDLPPDNKVLLRKKFGKNKIFKCMECQKGFKKQKKLIKHVMKRHKESLGQQKQPVDTGADIHELTKNGKDADGRWPCVVRRVAFLSCLRAASQLMWPTVLAADCNPDMVIRRSISFSVDMRKVISE